MHDALEVFSDAQDLAQVVGTYLSDKSVDLWGHAAQATVGAGLYGANTASPFPSINPVSTYTAASSRSGDGAPVIGSHVQYWSSRSTKCPT